VPAHPPAAPDPKSVVVNLTTGTGVEIEWKDGHRSSYSFQFLRDACPCALCDDERGKDDENSAESNHGGAEPQHLNRRVPIRNFNQPALAYAVVTVNYSKLI